MIEHRLVETSTPSSRTSLLSWALCDCAALIEAPVLAHLQDPHEPLRAAFEAHRTANGAVKAKGRNIGNDHGPSAWKRMSVK